MEKKKFDLGFTLVEILIALALVGIVAGGAIKAFIAQEDSFKDQIGVAALQQNLRTAMDFLLRDIRMAGFGNITDSGFYDKMVDWDPKNPGLDSICTFVQGADNISGISRYKNGTDSIVIVKSSREMRCLDPGESAIESSKLVKLGSMDLDGDGDVDLNNTGSRFCILARYDLTRSQLLKIDSISSSNLSVASRITKGYSKGDYIARADIIIYRVDDANKSFPCTVLERKNIGLGNNFQVVAENICDLQFRYILDDGTIVSDPSGDEFFIKAVFVYISAETTLPGKGIISRNLNSLVKIQNRKL